MVAGNPGALPGNRGRVATLAGDSSKRHTPFFQMLGLASLPRRADGNRLL